MNVYAVIDTNVLVSALLRWDSVPGAIMEHALIGSIIPVLSDEILAEYNEVLRREKFPFAEEDIVTLIDGVINRGVMHYQRKPTRPDGCDFLRRYHGSQTGK